jgi:aspartate carbamoyltransferase catalytic subunit
MTKLKHFISMEGVDKDTLFALFKTADGFFHKDFKIIEKTPLLEGKMVMSLFFEPSTRTRTSFEMAAKRLGADYFNIGIETSSAVKGESLLDMMDNLQAMQADFFIIRHSVSGFVDMVAKRVAPHVKVINAGDGTHAHPTQALLDMYTIRHYKKAFDSLKVAIVGDVLHSRVARSEIQALKTLNTKEIRVIGPRSLLPSRLEEEGVKVFHHMEEGLKDADVIITLRLQRERFVNPALPSSEEYFREYGLTQERLKQAKEDVIVMHPGPMNRGVEIVSEVADGPRSVILQQVTFGVATRMAVMAHLMD